VSTKNVYEHV